MPRQFVTWHTAQTPHGPCSWAVVDGLLHVRSALSTKIADIGGLKPESLAGATKNALQTKTQPDLTLILSCLSSRPRILLA